MDSSAQRTYAGSGSFLSAQNRKLELTPGMRSGLVSHRPSSETLWRGILCGVVECSLYLFLGMLMFPIDWKKFLHPGGVYRLEYPSYWDQVQKDEARSCGFGPHDRDDVGLWISLMPVSVDTDRMADELPNILNQVLPQMRGGDVHRDPTLRHHGV